MLPAAEIAELLEQNICIMCRALRLLIGASVEADKCVQRKQALFKRILQIRRGVGDIVRRLEQVGQRMAGDPASCFASTGAVPTVRAICANVSCSAAK